MSTAERASRATPAELLTLPAPSPEEILSRLPVSRRTQNSLLRFVAAGRASGPWSFARLLEIPGFGERSLEDVLTALGRKLGGTPAPRYGGGRLEEEVEALLASRSGRRGPTPTPALARAVALINGRLPASEEEIARRLRAAQLCRGPIDLARIERACRHGEVVVPFVILRREGLTVAVPADRHELAAAVYAVAVRAIVNWGLGLVRRIAFQARADDLDFVVALLEAKQNFRWVDKREGWFWFETSRSRLVRTIAKVLSVRSPVSVKDLACVLFRRWPADNAPSPRALRGLCLQLPGVDVVGGRVRLVGAPERRALSEREQKLVEVFERHGPQIEGHRLPELCERLGLAATFVGQIVRSSSFVIEPQPGVFRLIGT